MQAFLLAEIYHYCRIPPGKTTVVIFFFLLILQEHVALEKSALNLLPVPICCCNKIFYETKDHN